MILQLGGHFDKNDPLIHLYMYFMNNVILIFSPFANFGNQSLTSADFVLMLADVVLKVTTILKEMGIAQLCSKSVQMF